VMGLIALGGAVILLGLTLVSELSTSKLLKGDYPEFRVGPR
jgi:ABC-type protease/lipase transport system fused ATPase/permease subunit